jgi:hypothetical protein
VEYVVFGDNYTPIKITRVHLTARQPF